MKYLKVWTDFVKVLDPLEDDEVGRLFLAMLNYAATGQEPGDFMGNESFLWAVAKRDIDTMFEKDEKLRQNGQKGGIAKSKNKQTLANSTKPYQGLPKEEVATESVPNGSLKEIKRKEIKRNENKSSFLDDDDAHRIQQEHNTVIDAAERAGFASSEYVRDRLIALYSDNGLEKMLSGIESCVEHGATNLAYLQAVLTGKPKAKGGKRVEAQNYEQRDYTEVQKEIDRDMEREMEAFLKGAAG